MKLIVTDLKKCLGCHSCEIACAVSRSKSKTLLGAILEDPLPAPRVKVISAMDRPIPMQCHQCEDSPCASVCPTGALHRPEPDQPVFFNKELCIGCSSCVLACPFGAIRKAPGGIMAKCSLCWDRLAQGLEPACVEACPTGARMIAEADQVAEKKMRKMASVMAEQEVADQSLSQAGE